MKKAFTLVELLVVLGIIAILGGVLFGSISGSSESAKSARCLSNMKALASGCMGYGMATGYFPTAGSQEYSRIDESQGMSKAKEVYYELPGWISWYSAGSYNNLPNSPVASTGWIRSMYDPEDATRLFCITNGGIWKYMNATHDAYVCPSHQKAMKLLNPNWSYVMNAYFGWTANPGKDVHSGTSGRVYFRGLNRADRILLFAEIPWNTNLAVDQNVFQETTAGTKCDCVLQYPNLEGASIEETIGFNHKVGKIISGNVCFADGHCEKLTYPTGGMSQTDLKNLTEWLCTGIDVSFDGSKYEKLTAENNNDGN